MAGLKALQSEGTTERSAKVLDSLLKSNRHRIAVEGGRLVGPGARLLTDAARDAQFFMLGESHNGADTPRFAVALFDALRDYGYRYYAIEYGPVIGRLLSQVGVRGSDEATLSLGRRYPHAFQFWNDEELLAMSAIGRISVSHGDPIWGLDNEWGALHALERLLKLSTDSRAKAAVDALIARVQPIESQRPLAATETLSRFIASADSATFDALRRAMAPAPGSEAAEVIEALEQSNRIYLQNFAASVGALTGWTSNARRERYIKDNLMRQYRRALRAGDSLPRVLLKFGSVHAGNWLSPTNVHTIGSFVHEFAIANGQNSFSVVAWQVNRPGDYWTLTESPAYLPLARVGSTTEWWVVDLRPLRPFVHAGLLPSASRELRALVFAYDAALLMGSGKQGSHNRLRNVDGTEAAADPTGARR